MSPHSQVKESQRSKGRQLDKKAAGGGSNVLFRMRLEGWGRGGTAVGSVCASWHGFKVYIPQRIIRSRDDWSASVYF